MTHSPWDEPTSSTTTTLSSVLTDKIFFSFKLKHVATRLSNYYMAYLHILYSTLNFPILMDLSASKNISMTFQGYVEEWNSKFPRFKFSIPCPVWTLISFTSHLMSLNSIILPLTVDTAKQFPPEKKATERFRISPSLHKVSLVKSKASISKNKSSVTSWCNSWDWLPRDICACYVEPSSRAGTNEHREETLTMECPSLKKGSVAVYLRSLRIRAAEQKNISRPSRELMSSK